MEMLRTQLGQVIVADQAAIFEQMARSIQATLEKAEPIVALSGGSTPKAFYRWAVETKVFDPAELARVWWLVSDERVVPLDHDDSNFGHLVRGLLDPLGLPAGRRLPFPTLVDAYSGSRRFRDDLVERFGDRPIDLCFLGMGDDGHTASIFPESPLLTAEVPERFACVEVPGKGWRHSLTPAGLATCQRIQVLVTGSGKAERMAEVHSAPIDPLRLPVQVLAEYADRVDWLVDQEAASGLSLPT